MRQPNFCLAVLLFSFVENNIGVYQSTNELKFPDVSQLEVEERHRKYIYCTQACNGHSLRATCSDGKELKNGNDNVDCLCPKSTTVIKNSNCWTENHQPKSTDLQRQFQMCGHNCRTQVTTIVFPALCIIVEPKPAIANKAYDCFCVQFREMLDSNTQLKE